jgi:hypothetical protein
MVVRVVGMPALTFPVLLGVSGWGGVEEYYSITAAAIGWGEFAA